VPIVLLRIDERLIHGQVVIGWANQLRPDRYVVVDDDLATSEWEQDLYRLGAGDAEVLFASCTDAKPRLAEWRDARERTIVLTRDVSTMRRLVEGGVLRGESVVVGGVHHAPGRREAVTYVHLTETEMADLGAISAAGLDVFARDLPDAHSIDFEHLRRRWNSSN
jgi:mannose/fructose/N-acetylgalactosamine-specific phosphotransferase system component IIB